MSIPEAPAAQRDIANHAQKGAAPSQGRQPHSFAATPWLQAHQPFPSRQRAAMKQTILALLLIPLAAFCAENPVSVTSPLTLNGRISDNSDHPIANVRVGLRSNGAVAQTDQNGQFTLTLNAGHPFTRDQTKVYDYVELDKDGYVGRTINIQELSFFDHPMAEKLEPNPITEDRAEFSTRISMGYTLSEKWSRLLRVQLVLRVSSQPAGHRGSVAGITAAVVGGEPIFNVRRQLPCPVVLPHMIIKLLRVLRIFVR